MKRRDLIRRIEALGCMFVCEGGSHTKYRNPYTQENVPIPRHAEIDERLAKKILRDAEKR